MLTGYERRRFCAFSANVPDMDLFPIDLWTQLNARRLRRLSADLMLGCDAIGYRPLREALADYLNASRGVNCTADQVTMLEGADNVVLDTGAADVFGLPLVPLDEQIRRAA